MLAGILPTADRMTRLVKKAETSGQLEQLMPDRTIIIDGTEVVPRQRPQDRDKRKNTYSGKKKRFTINTTITTNRAGPMLAAGRSFEGGTHDLAMIREDPTDWQVV